MLRDFVYRANAAIQPGFRRRGHTHTRSPSAYPFMPSSARNFSSGDSAQTEIPHRSPSVTPDSDYFINPNTASEP
jgi:hypothetical protein